jgi:hypothetical protein
MKGISEHVKYDDADVWQGGLGVGLKYLTTKTAKYVYRNIVPNSYDHHW